MLDVTDVNVALRFLSLGRSPIAARGTNGTYRSED
jgi:hypothetical protein